MAGNARLVLEAGQEHAQPFILLLLHCYVKRKPFPNSRQLCYSTSIPENERVARQKQAPEHYTKSLPWNCMC
jgi:hypothetical protein